MSWTTWGKRFARPTQEAEKVLSLSDHIRLVNPRFHFYRHNQLLIEALEAVAAGDVLNLMIWQPPGTGKSETTPRMFGSFLMRQRPRCSVGITSYGAMLAQEMTRDAREYYVESGGQLNPAQRAKTHWKSLQGGGMWGAGFGGTVRGFRYNCGIVDDPHKDIDSIDSDIKRERLFRWWDNTWMNRGQLFTDDPISRIIVMQRLADNDLCGWLLGRPDADKWTVVGLDAVRDAVDPLPIPEGVKVWPDWRRHGELLCPERLSQQTIDEQKNDPDGFAAQFQQRPMARSGRIIQPEWFGIIKEGLEPPMLHRCVGVDLAVSSKQSADYTVGFCVALGVDGRYYIFRPYRDKQESPITRVQIAALAARRKSPVVAVESVAFQLSYIQELRRMREMAGIAVIEADADRDKQARARGWSHFAQQGLMMLVDDGSGWVDRFLDEVRSFPRTGGSRHDDQVDAIGIAMEGLRHHKTTRFGVAGKRQTVMIR